MDGWNIAGKNQHIVTLYTDRDSALQSSMKLLTICDIYLQIFFIISTFKIDQIKNFNFTFL